LDLLPPRISNPELLGLLADILAMPARDADRTSLRRRLTERGFSWQALTDLAIGQGVLFPLTWALRRRGLLLPLPRRSRGDVTLDHPTATLEAAYRRHLARRDAQRDQLVALVAALNRAHISPLLLKGARYLLAPQGDWCEARDMRDIDLLVRRDEAAKAVAALAAAGYVAEPGFVPIDQHLPEMWRAGEPSAVELHIEALSFAGRRILATDEVWRRSGVVATEAGSFRVLPDEWHLLHGLLNHQVSDRGHARHLLALKALWEFAMLARDFPDSAWREVADHLASAGRLELLTSWLLQAARLFGLAYPGWIEMSPAARAHADRTFGHAVKPDWRRRAAFLADQLRHGFARETMAMRYGLAESEVSLGTVARHLRFLVGRYRGNMLRRLIGQGDRAF
jgi:hypothetical protein